MPFHLPSRRVLIGATCLLVIHAYATPLARAPKTAGPLSVSINVPPSVSDVSKFAIELTLKNTGDKDFSVVRDPSGPLFEGLAINAWDWQLASSKGGSKNKERATPAKDGKGLKKDEDKKGKDEKDKDKGGKDEDGKLDKDEGKTKVLPANSKEPEFIGASVAWTIDSYLSQTTPALGGKDSKDGKKDEKVDKEGKKGKRAAEKASKTMIPLKKGGSTKVIYQVGSAYDFTKSGAGTYSLKLARDTLWITFDQGKTTEEVKITVPKQSVKISGKLAGKAVTTKKQGESKLARRAVRTHECDAAQISIIERSAAAADDYAYESYTYLTTNSARRDRYEWWFGPWNHHRAPPNQALFVRDHVIRAYRVMTRRSFVSGHAYNCACEFNIIAFVTGSRYHDPVINLCNLFWGATVPNSGHNSRAGTLIHEASHFHDVAKSLDYDEYRDMRGTHLLAMNAPEPAAQSANNYRFFSENRDNRE